MPDLFALSAMIAVITACMAVSRKNAVHALLYLVAALLSVAVAIYALGAPYIAALEVIIYAGAIMVLFVFVTMMLNLGREQEDHPRPPGKRVAPPSAGRGPAPSNEAPGWGLGGPGLAPAKRVAPPLAGRGPAPNNEARWQPALSWRGPVIVAAGVLAEFFWVLFAAAPPTAVTFVGPHAVGVRLFTGYIVGVELVSMLLLAAIVAAYHLGYGLLKKQAAQGAGR